MRTYHPNALVLKGVWVPSTNDTRLLNDLKHIALVLVIGTSFVSTMIFLHRKPATVNDTQTFRQEVCDD